MLFKIYWQHNYQNKGVTDHVSERECDSVEAAETYAKSLSCGTYRVCEAAAHDKPLRLRVVKT